MDRTSRLKAVRHDYFQHIDSPVKAYVLGLLASDGCIQAQHYGISLEIHEKDIEIVELARNELAPLHEIKHRSDRPAVRLGISSRQMKEDLIGLGVTPRKSLTLTYPGIPAEYDNSFILGCFDGDGSLSFTKPTNKHRRYPQWKLASGSRGFLLEVQRRIAINTGIAIGGPYREGGILTLATNWGKVTPVDAWLHADMPGLTRKRLPCPSGMTVLQSGT